MNSLNYVEAVALFVEYCLRFAAPKVDLPYYLTIHKAPTLWNTITTGLLKAHINLS
jgi:hypothetical protein